MPGSVAALLVRLARFKTTGRITETIRYFFLHLNSFELPLTSKSSSFPASSALVVSGSEAISFAEVTTEPQRG